MNKKLIFLGIFFLIFSFLVYNSKAEINLTIQSQDERIIKTINLNNFSLISSNSTNQTINIPYDNYILEIQPSSKKIDNSTFFINLKSVVDDRANLFWLIVLLVIIALSVIVVRHYNGR